MDQIKKDASYSVGMSIGQSLQGQNLDQIDLDSFIEGINAIFNNKQLRFTPNEANDKITTYINSMNEERFGQYKSDGENFLSENAKRDEVTVTSSGLQYEVNRKH